MLERNIVAVPKHEQLRQLLLERIAAGEFRPGGRFPTQRELMSAHALSYSTVSRALADLAREGYITRTVGSGTRVAERARALGKGPLIFHCAATGPLEVSTRSGEFALFRGFLDGARSLGAEVRVHEDASAAGRAALLDAIERSREGLAVPYFAGNRRLVDELRSRRIRHVVIDVPLEVPGYSAVVCDHRAGARKLAEILLEAGHDAERVGCIVGSVSDEDRHQWSTAKARGFFDALGRDGSHPLVATALGATPEEEIEAGALAAARMLDDARGHGGLTAIAADGSYKALGAAREILARGLRVPEDVSLVSINRLAAWDPVPFPLTHAWAPRAEVGEAAARVLYEELAGGDAGPHARVDMVIERGRSVAPPRR